MNVVTPNSTLKEVEGGWGRGTRNGQFEVKNDSKVQKERERREGRESLNSL